MQFGELPDSISFAELNFDDSISKSSGMNKVYAWRNENIQHSMERSSTILPKNKIKLMSRTFFFMVYVATEICICSIRLFIARRKEIVISLVKLSTNIESLNVVEVRIYGIHELTDAIQIIKLGKIYTNIMNPSHFVVSRMEEIPDRSVDTILSHYLIPSSEQLQCTE